MKVPSMVPFCSESSWSAGETATTVPPSAGRNAPIVGGGGRTRRARARQDPGPRGAPRGGEVVVPGHRRHRGAEEVLDGELAAGSLLDALAPADQPFRHEVLRADATGHLHLGFLLCGP